MSLSSWHFSSRKLLPFAALSLRVPSSDTRVIREQPRVEEKNVKLSSPDADNRHEHSKDLEGEKNRFAI